MLRRVIVCSCVTSLLMIIHHNQHVFFSLSGNCIAVILAQNFATLSVTLLH
jgi:hypothetical protein